MKDLRTEVDRLTRESYAFPIVPSIRMGFELLTASIGSHIGYLLLAAVISFVALIIPLVNIIVGYGVMLAALMGFATYAYKVQTRQEPKFGDYFGGFQHFVQLWIMTLMYLGVIVLASWPIISKFFSMAMSGEMSTLAGGNPMEFFSIFADLLYYIAFLFIALTFILTAVQFAPYFVIFGGMSAWEGIVASFRVLIRKWWSAFALNLLLGVAGYLLVIILSLTLATIDPSLAIVSMLLVYLLLGPLYMLIHYSAFSLVTNLTDNHVSTDDLLSEIGSDEDPA